jgi:LPS export ABC transporter protein LptC
VATYTNLAKQPVIEVKKIEVMYSDSGQVKAILKAPVVRQYADSKEPYKEFPEGIEVTFYSSTNVKESDLTAKYAILYEKKQLFIAKNNVIAHDLTANKTLNTEELHWDMRTERFTSDKFVRITSPEDVIMGEGFEANQDFRNWKIKKIKNSFVILKDE